jgi:hypothetical protein
VHVDARADERRHETERERHGEREPQHAEIDVRGGH